MPLLRLPSLSLAAVLCAMLVSSPAAAQDAAAKVSGKFTGNGKEAAIKFVRVEEHEPFSDKEAFTLIFTEKDPATAKKPSFDAMFGKLGSAIIVNVHVDGGIFGCQVMHSAHTKQGFSSIGQIKTNDLKIADGRVSGQVLTPGVLDTFGEKWEVDLKFSAPMPPKTAKSAAAPAKSGAASAKSATSEPIPVPKAAAGPAGPAPAARKLPLPGDAQSVDYKALVKQIQFSSAQSVEAVANELSGKLKEAGWKEAPGSLKGPRNAILRRQLGEAKLTITIQPEGTGSMTRIFGEGLSWD